MAYAEDIPQYASIKLDTAIYVDKYGKPVNETTEYHLKNVIKLINGTIGDVDHLIGHSKLDTDSLLTYDGLLESTYESRAKLCGKSRNPGPYLIEDCGQLYGVVIDCSNQLKVVGVIRYVIPGQHQNGYYKAVKYDCNGQTSTLCNPKDFDLRTLIKNGAIFGIISIDGFLFAPFGEVVADNGLTDLILILQNGYFISSGNLSWTRSTKLCQPIKGLESLKAGIKSSTLETDDCFIAKRGGCVRAVHSLQIFGSLNAIVKFSAFRDCLVSLQTVDSVEKRNDLLFRYGLQVSKDQKEGDFVGKIVSQRSEPYFHDKVVDNTTGNSETFGSK